MRTLFRPVAACLCPVVLLLLTPAGCGGDGKSEAGATAEDDSGDDDAAADDDVGDNDDGAPTSDDDLEDDAETPAPSTDDDADDDIEPGDDDSAPDDDTDDDSVDDDNADDDTEAPEPTADDDADDDGADDDATEPTPIATPVPTGPIAAYPESILCPGNQSDSRCGPGYSAEQALPETELQTAFAEGLAAWTRADSTGGACAHCHSPDGIDLAKIGYSDCDIRRRALDHVSEAEADAIVHMIHALRQVYQVERPLHPDKFRPLQPSYEPFEQPGTDVDVANTNNQDRWDEQFMNYLVEDLQLTWATTRIDSLALARQAYEELNTLDLHSIRLGIPFDRFSEDPNAVDNECTTTSGPAHSGQSIFEWVPGLPTAPRPGSEATWNALLDAYRADPSTENLWRYYDAIDSLTDCGTWTGEEYERACEWMHFKYKSVQVLQHMLRTDSARHPDQLADLRQGNTAPSVVEHLDTVIHRSPIWETADLIRLAPLERRGNPACFSSPAHPCTFLPEELNASVHSIPSHQEALIQQGDLFQASWFIMSFLDDPTLTTHAENFATFIGDYLESVILPRYDVHHAFIFAVMAVRKSAATEWFEHPSFRRGTGKIASVRTFSFKQVRDNFSPPASGPRLATHRRMFANFARMFLFLVEDDLRRSGTVFGRDGSVDGSPTQQGGLLSAVRFMREWIEDLEGAEDPAINQLVVSIEQLALAAQELRPQSDYNAYDGLQPTSRWGEYQTPYAP